MSGFDRNDLLKIAGRGWFASS